MKRYLPFISLLLLCLSACSPDPKGNAICNCTENGSAAIYTLGKMSMAQADAECNKIQAQLPVGDSCHAFINH